MAIEIPTQVSDRLATETIAWLTTTRADGMPLPNPVWFLWHGDEFLVATMLGSVKMKNMQRNPLVSLHLDTLSLDGSDVVVFQGKAAVDCAPFSPAEFKAYIAKYDEKLALLGITREMLQSDYQLVRIKPIKFRTVTG